MAGTLIRRTSPCTRIIGGRPEDKCKSDALFLTTKASNSVRSITILPNVREGFFFAGSSHYDNNRRQPASRESAHRSGRAGRSSRWLRGGFTGGFQDAFCCAHQRSAQRRPALFWRELRAGSA